MKKQTYLMLLVGLAVQAQAQELRAAEQAPAVDTSQWKCKFCAFPEEGISGQAEVGAGNVSESSAKFGDYTGLNKQGAFFIGNADVRSRGENAWYWNLRARNLGLDSRSIGVDGGRQGRFGVSFDYSELPHFLSDSAKTVFVGDENLTLPAGWVFADPTTAMTGLATALHPVNIETQRKRIGTGASFIAGSRWQFQVNFRRDTKQGHKRTAGDMFFNSAQFLEPIDYQTDQLDASAAYSGTKLQARFAYHGSFFSNSIKSQTWVDPFSTTVPPATGQHALPPDNQFHQLLASMGYQWTASTRVMADVAVGEMTQDDPFLPVTTNAAIAVPALPQTSLNGRVKTLTANLKMVSDLTDKLRVNAAVMRDDRDNQTPQAAYTRVITDTVLSPTPRVNTPYSFTNDSLKLNADYRLPQRSKLSAGVDRDKTQRTFLEGTETTEDTYWVQAKTNMFEKASLGVKYSRSARDGTYQVVPTTVPAQNPLMRKYNMADRDRDNVAARLTLLPVDRVTVGLGADVAHDNYTESVIGLTDAQDTTLSADVSVAVSETTSMHVFYNRQRIESSQKGASTGVVFGLPDWKAENKDNVDTAGIGIKHRLIANKLDIGADYFLSHSKSAIKMSHGDLFQDHFQFPDLTTDLASLKVYGTYRFGSSLSLNAAFLHETYSAKDWSIDGTTATTLPDVLLLGEKAPDYNVNVITMSVRYAFK